MENTAILSNVYDLVGQWIERELKHVNLGDRRLFKRLIKTGICIEGYNGLQNQDKKIISLVGNFVKN